MDVRDGHLTVPAVDLWGPGRTPLVVRSYTNTQASQTSGPGNWQFNQLLDLLYDSTAGYRVREPDGNRSLYKYSTTRWSGTTDKWDVYVKDWGTYSTLEIHSTSVEQRDPEGPGGPQSGSGTPRTTRVRRPGPSATTLNLICTEDGAPMLYLPKGVSRRYAGSLIAEIRDANGNVVSYTSTPLTGGPYVWKVRDPVGREVTYNYETAGGALPRVQSVVDPYGRTATYTYAGWGQIASATNGAGRTTTYAYDADGRLAAVTDARGNTTTIEWATVGGSARVARVVASGGAATTYAYTTHPTTGRVTRTVVTNARGHATTYDLYAGEDSNYFGNVERVTDPLGNVTQYAYDARHNVTQVTDPRNNRTTYTYNSRNKVTQMIRAVGSLNLTSTLTWDTNDNLLSVTNPRTIRTDYTYNDLPPFFGPMIRGLLPGAQATL